jgi:hypothetical protein
LARVHDLICFSRAIAFPALMKDFVINEPINVVSVSESLDLTALVLQSTAIQAVRNPCV